MFVLKSDERTVTLQVLHGREEAESLVAEREGSRLRSVWQHQDGRSASLEVAPNEESVHSTVTIGGDSFEIDSPGWQHGFLLASAIKERDYPTSSDISAFVDRARNDDSLKSEMKAMIRMMDGPDGVIIACIAFCAACALDFVLSCFQCIICAGGGVAESPRSYR
jgi:hypothetical protein